MLNRWLGKRAARAARRRGDAARTIHDWDTAAACYRTWLVRFPNDAAIWIQLGHMLAEAGELAEADRAYREAHRLTPDDADLELNRGHLAKRQGDRAKALVHYERSMALDGNEDAVREYDALVRPGGRPARLRPVDGSYVGEIEGWLDRHIAGHVMPPPNADGPVSIVFTVGGREVGRAQPGKPRPGGGYDFRTFLDIDMADGSGVSVEARLEPGGTPLLGSPVGLNPAVSATGAAPAASAAAIVVKPPRIAPGQEVALFVTHSATGRIKPHVLPHVEAFAAQGIAVLLVAVVDRPLDLDPALLDRVAGAMVRANEGWDFAAWAHALTLWPEAWGAETLYLVNDSVFGPARGGLDAIVARVRASDAALVGLTESQEYGWHLQSYFLALKRPLLSSWALHNFFGGIRILSSKDEVIRQNEVRLGALAEAEGHEVEVLFPSPAPLNPTLFDWRGLVERGFPYIKLNLLRGDFPEADLTGWRAALDTAGFDIDLLDATRLPGPSSIPDSGDRALLARPHRIAAATAGDAPLKVALYGPWNYDNGLGGACRNLIGALRRTGARLNLHPIERPFHIHRPLGPARAITDFAGPADIAIVHLNPDSWHLLTDEQRTAIAQAKRRIGYWVWEMEHIPPAWNTDFTSVDRIWSPSGWCAGLFAGHGEAAVDVIPHPVPLAPPAPDMRATTLAGLGLDPQARIILYVFDGSSYLVRKNPAALVRAFGASGLAAQGWRLVLKTKHLMDRPAEGAAFRDLATGTDGVVLIDRTMDEAALSTLVAACDIYASPHCAEGFGLTVSEAMAAGKAVVATDYSGTTDMLDTTTGWPVPAARWVLAEDFGHYTKGGAWARVDEAALAGALREAADAVDRGDQARPAAARARAASRLSYDAVGARIADSFAAVMRDRTIERPYPRRDTDLATGIRFADAVLGPDIRAVPLEQAGRIAADGKADEGGWIALAPADAIASPWFAREMRRAFAARPDAAIFYGDDFALGEPGLEQVRLKTAFDPVLLAAQDGIGAPLIVRAKVLAALGGIGAGIDDLLLRAHAAGHSIARVPAVLLAHRGARPKRMAAERQAMLAPHFPDYSLNPGRTPALLELARRFDGAEPAVTIVVPTRRSAHPDGGTYIERLLDGLAATDWPMDRLTVLVGDDVVGPADWADAARPFAVRRIETPRPDGAPFNYAAKMNALWRAAETEHLVLVNDDVTPMGTGWLRALMTFAVDAEVGGVGARLLYPDGRLQHAGIAPLFGHVAHAWLGRRQATGSYQDWALSQRSWSAVTGAVFATRRSAMEQVDGFDERFTLIFNDVDLCLRMRALGLSILYNPAAEMLHAEKASRGETPPDPREMALFATRWGAWLAEDPAWHPGLDDWQLDVRPAGDPQPWYG